MFSRPHLAAVLVLAAVPLWSQAGSSGAKPAGEAGAIWSQDESLVAAATGEEAPMITPAPFSDEGYSLAFASEIPRTNYLHGGLSLGTVYDDNILPSSGQGISDVRYSIWPSVSLEQSRSRLRWDLNYSPGFRFYQGHGSLNGIDHDLALGVQYRLSPHVTLSVGESFQKKSDVLNLSEAGIVQGAASSILPPDTTAISHSADVSLTYQFGQNEMIGTKAALSGLWYPNRAHLDGLSDSTAAGNEIFYAHRISGNHYLGATYGFRKLFTHPGRVETQSQNSLLFYTFYLPPTLSLSFFAGPEYSITSGATTLPLRTWSPALGASLGWHRGNTSMLASYAQKINDGGGLSGAVRSNSAETSIRWRFARAFTTNVGGSYVANRVLDSGLLSGEGGHTWSGTASLEHPFAEHLAMQIGYTRLNQSYPNVLAISRNPIRNNIWISLAYQFERPLGR